MTTDNQSLPAPPEREFLTVKETAEFLNVSASLIYKLCVEQKLEHYRFGDGDSAIRIDRNGLMEFIKQRHVKKHETPEEDAVVPRSGKRVPYICKYMDDDRRVHPCGGLTKNGTPCKLLTYEAHCRKHRNQLEATG